jgi:hypothetical protein
MLNLLFIIKLKGLRPAPESFKVGYMTRFLLSCLALLFALTASAQNFNGQWKGHFKVNGADDMDEYMLELQVSDPTHVTGFSYTYFSEAGFRYFTICRVSGVINRASKTVTVTELKKIKGNMPPGVRDCLQVHTLTFFKNEEGQTLEGSWKPAPGFDYGCGSGTTLLSRKMLVRIKPVTPSAKGKASAAARAEPKAVTPHAVSPKPHTAAPIHTPHPTLPASAPPTAPLASAHRDATPLAKGPATHKAPAHKPLAAAGHPAPTLRRELHKDTSALPAQGNMAAALPRPPAATPAIVLPPPQVRRRSNDIVQTIELGSPEIKIELYDDGVIDHDTVTVYFNGKAVVWKNMLSHHPISLTLQAIPDRDNDLILYADNLGDIPPNTALMVVYAGGEKYDIRVTSDEQKNGAVRFRLKEGK